MTNQAKESAQSYQDIVASTKIRLVQRKHIKSQKSLIKDKEYINSDLKQAIYLQKNLQFLNIAKQ